MIEHEAELNDYLEVFWKYRKTIFKIFVIVMSLTALGVILGPKRYTVDTYFRVGKIAGYSNEGVLPKFIEHPSSLVERLSSIYKIRHVVSLSPSSVIKTTFKGFNKKNVTQEAETFKVFLLKEHGNEFSKYNNKLLKDIEILNNRIEQMENEIIILEKRGKNKDALWALDANGQSVLLKRRDELWIQKLDLNEIQSLYEEKIVFPSSFLEADGTPAYDPVWSIALIALGLALSLGASVFLILYKEATLRNRR
ncbi:hypothetical protein K8S19_04950 [bacterium]|nr:hypothetical protein [bacterium]